MDVIDLYIFDNAGTTTAVVAPIELQHTEQAYTLYARIPGDTAIGDGYAVGFKCIDNRFRIFDITDHTAMEPDDVIEINAIDQAVRELTDEPITDLRPQNVTVTQAVTRLISSTRFIIGNVSCSNTGGMTAYYESVWDALVDARAAFDCVLVPYFEITGGIITARKIDILARNGADRGRIFELGDDLADIRIKYDESQIKTALFGRGRGVELDGGDGDPTYGRRLTFADVVWSTSDGDPADKPEGQEWIGDPDALAAYSRDGRHRFGFVTFDSEEDADALLQKTWDKLQELKQPRITIECTVLDTERTMGRSHEAVRYGDGVLVRIAKRGIDIDAKVSGIVRDYIRPERTKLTIGNAAPSAGKIVADLQATLDNYSGRASVWDRSSAFDIDGAMDVMNNQILSTVGGWYTDPDTGAIMLVSQDGAKAMRLTGAGWQIANEKVGDAWVWRTAATGGGIVADQITTGVLNANLIRAGTLSDFVGANFWDLTTGEFRLSSTSTYIDDSQISIGDVITNVDVEYAQNQSMTMAPDSGWSTTAPARREGYYIWQRTATTTSDGSTTYSTATCIQGADGADGTGITSIQEQYYLSTSSSTQTGGSWSTAQPAWVSGKYIWTRSKITWSDSTTTYTAAVLAKAINGANETAKSATDVQTQSGIFNLLTNNGQLQGIYMSDGNLYINASYIATGTLSADRIGASSLSLGKLATGSVFSAISDTGMTVTHGGASNAYTTLDASGLRMYNSAGSMIGGLYVPTGQSAVKMGASSLMNPSYPNFSIQMESQWSGEAMAYYYMLSFFRRNTFAFGLGVEDDDNFSGGFVMDKSGNSTSLDTIIEVAKTWSGVDPSALTATEVNYGTGQMRIWQENGSVYFKSPGDIFLIMNINGHTLTLRMSDVYDLINP